MKKIIFFTLVFIGFLCQSNELIAKNRELAMKSPGGIIEAQLILKNGVLSYVVEGENRKLIYPSSLGIRIDGRVYGKAVDDIREIKQIPNNKLSAINSSNNYQFLILEKGFEYNIEFNLSEQGLAFRYIVNGKVQRNIDEELTEFKLTNSPVWFFERDNSWKLKTYAGLWQKTTTDSLHIISKQGPIQGKPLLFELPENRYLLLTEAALYNYSGLRFNAQGDGVLQVNFTEKGGFKINGPIVTPWRILLYAKNLNDLVNNTLIKDLNPEPDKTLFRNIDYIKPGRAVWSWITRDSSYMKPEYEKRFIDAASELNFEYTLLDEGWETKWEDKYKQLKELTEYAQKKNVGVWVWKHSKYLRDSIQRDLFLDSIQRAGVVGVKTDFMDSEAKSLIDFEIGFLKAAAKRRLMVNFHGCHSPTGESKTYPNEMTREGVRGMELNIMGEPIPAEHNAALPFTRFILGHGDYTPGLFYNRGNTTHAHQLALFYLLDSPFQCLAENPIRITEDKIFKPIVPLLRELPVIWDETIVLQGSKIGEVAAFARRKGEDWYVSVVNGTNTNQKIVVKFDFLSKTKKYVSKSIMDSPERNGFVKDISSLKKLDTKEIDILPNGGTVLQIKSDKF